MAGPSTWNAVDHAVYLRGVLAALPGCSEADVMAAILRDHGVTIERNGPGYFALNAWLHITRSTNLDTRQLAQYYADWVQARRSGDPHLATRALLVQFESEQNMQCARKTFERWVATLPLQLQKFVRLLVCTLSMKLMLQCLRLHPLVV